MQNRRIKFQYAEYVFPSSPVLMQVGELGVHALGSLSLSGTQRSKTLRPAHPTAAGRARCNRAESFRLPGVPWLPANLRGVVPETQTQTQLYTCCTAVALYKRELTVPFPLCQPEAESGRMAAGPGPGIIWILADTDIGVFADIG
jgi:hypothetical protein